MNLIIRGLLRVLAPLPYLFLFACMGGTESDSSSNSSSSSSNSSSSSSNSSSSSGVVITPVDCVPSKEFLTYDVMPALLNDCGGCHTIEGFNGARIYLQEPAAEYVEDNFLNLRTLALEEVIVANGESLPLLLAKPSAQVLHSGGEKASVGSPSYNLLAELVERYQTPLTCDDDSTVIVEDNQHIGKPDVGHIHPISACSTEDIKGGDSMARRMTNIEYLNSIRDILGVDISDLADDLPADIKVEGFTNTTFGLVSSLDLISAYSSLAEEVVNRMDSIASIAGANNCQPSSTQCRNLLIDYYGLRLYRRPVTQQERTDLYSMFNGEANLESAASKLVRVLLQAPQFLYRLEDETGDDVKRLTAYELAARLSFLVWNSSPDDTLLALAADDSLLERSVLDQQVNRLLNDSRAKPTAKRFVKEWLNVDVFAEMQINQQHFPQVTRELQQDMLLETEDFIDRVMWRDNLPLVDLYNHPSTAASSELANYYGLTSEQLEGSTNSIPGFDSYTLNGIERQGILTQASILTAASGGAHDPSVVSRGLFLLENVLCDHSPPPPPELNVTPMEPEAGKSNRYYSEQRVNSSACGACHSNFDPLAWGLEAFGAAGQMRTEDSQGNPVPADGFLTEGGVDYAFEGTQDFVALLAQNPRAQDCITIKSVQFAIGRQLDRHVRSDACFLSDVKSRAGGATMTYRDLIQAIATSSAFTHVDPIEPAPTVAPVEPVLPGDDIGAAHFAAASLGGPGQGGCILGDCVERDNYIDLSEGSTFIWRNIEGGSGGLRALRIHVGTFNGSTRSMSLWVNGRQVGVVTENKERGASQLYLVELRAGSTNTIELRDTEGTLEFNIFQADILLVERFSAVENEGGPGIGGCSGECSQTDDQAIDLENSDFTWSSVTGEGEKDLYFRVGSPSGSRTMSAWVNGEKNGVITADSTMVVGPVEASLNQGDNVVSLRNTENTREFNVYELLVVQPHP